MNTINIFLFVMAGALILVDGFLTLECLRIGGREMNPFADKILKEGGARAFMLTKILAILLLLILTIFSVFTIGLGLIALISASAVGWNASILVHEKMKREVVK